MLAFIVPVVCMVTLSYYLAVGQLGLRARAIAKEVLLRQQAISVQTAHARASLTARSAQVPCSPSQIDLMRDLALGASYLQAVGYVRNNRLICSSYGNHGAGIPIGAADYLSATGLYVRHAVELPIGTNQKFIVVSGKASGYSTLELPDWLLDVRRANPDFWPGLVAVSRPMVIVSSGDLNVKHIPSFAPHELELKWVDANGLGAMTRLSGHDYAGVAFIPRSSMLRTCFRIGTYLAPFGILLGLASSTLVCLWIKHWTSMLSRLRRAIRRNELSLHYMPIVELESNQIVGAEALLRWHSSTGESIGPDRFIPLAEQHRLIGQITRAMLTIFAKDAPSLMRVRPNLYISLNLSPGDFLDPAIIARLEDVRQSVGLRNLMVEVTEGTFLDIERAQLTIHQLHDAGTRVAIDDFGTGYSNLSYLGDLEIDCLKIDRTFVSAIGTESVKRHVADHIIALARQFGLTIIAEGVETEAQAAHLKAAGVQYAQGWLYGKPTPAGVFASLLQSSITL
ncbi:EAL domain-containing protein [Paraburkholderia sediminicola]|uniref:EAL domain-containing protein n=1 Tax=Paraburkholderia sediminicola TaxID=458836 RepID=UPI0038B99192